MFKKIAATVMALAGIVACTYGQGTVVFNTQLEGTNAQVYDTSSLLVGATGGVNGSNFFAQLYGLAGTGRAASELQPIGYPVNFRNGLVAGWNQANGTTSLGQVIN